jgi:hypothetical protein
VLAAFILGIILQRRKKSLMVQQGLPIASPSVSDSFKPATDPATQPSGYVEVPGDSIHMHSMQQQQFGSQYLPHSPPNYQSQKPKVA